MCYVGPSDKTVAFVPTAFRQDFGPRVQYNTCLAQTQSINVGHNMLIFIINTTTFEIISSTCTWRIHFKSNILALSKMYLVYSMLLIQPFHKGSRF